MKIVAAAFLIIALAGCDLSVTNDAGVRQIRWKISPWPPAQVVLTPAPSRQLPPQSDGIEKPIVYREDF